MRRPAVTRLADRTLIRSSARAWSSTRQQAASRRWADAAAAKYGRRGAPRRMPRPDQLAGPRSGEHRQRAHGAGILAPTSWPPGGALAAGQQLRLAPIGSPDRPRRCLESRRVRDRAQRLRLHQHARRAYAWLAARPTVPGRSRCLRPRRQVGVRGQSRRVCRRGRLARVVGPPASSSPALTRSSRRHRVRDRAGQPRGGSWRRWRWHNTYRASRHRACRPALRGSRSPITARRRSPTGSWPPRGSACALPRRGHVRRRPSSRWTGPGSRRSGPRHRRRSNC